MVVAIQILYARMMLPPTHAFAPANLATQTLVLIGLSFARVTLNN